MDAYRKTHLDMISSIILGLKKWLKDKSYLWQVDSRIFTNDNIVNTSNTSQMIIGWYSILCGFISNDLVDLECH